MTTRAAPSEERWARLIAEHRENQRRAERERPPRVPLLAAVPLLLFWPFWLALGHLLLALGLFDY